MDVAVVVAAVENDVAVFVVLYSILKLSRTRRTTKANTHSWSLEERVPSNVLFVVSTEKIRDIEAMYKCCFSLPLMFLLCKGY